MAYMKKEPKNVFFLKKININISGLFSMRIGINASFLRKQGTGIGQVTYAFLQELSLQLSKQKKQAMEYILYLEEDAKDEEWMRIFQKRVFLPKLWKRDDLVRKILWEKYTLPKMVKKDNCDVLLSVYQSATVAPKGVKHIMLVHDIIPHLFPEYLNNGRKKKYQRLIERSIARADKIMAISRKTAEDLKEYLGIDSKKIVVNYIDAHPILKKKAGMKRREEVLKRYRLERGYIYNGGGLEKRKNTENVLRAYKLLIEKNRKEKFLRQVPNLVISGKLMPQLAPLITDVELLVKKMQLSSRVKVLDFVPQEDLPALYANASVFIFPSLYEGFGLPVLEAMSQGTPVITSHTSSLPEVGKDAVLYCDPENIDDIAFSMQNILLDKSLQKECSKRGILQAKSFSWEKFVQKTYQVIRSK